MTKTQPSLVYENLTGLHETVLGKEHPSTQTSINNLALMLSDQGKYEYAEEIHRQALGLREGVLSREHPPTLARHEQPGQCTEESGQV
jgi:hypothetical protein